MELVKRSPKIHPQGIKERNLNFKQAYFSWKAAPENEWHVEVVPKIRNVIRQKRMSFSTATFHKYSNKDIRKMGEDHK